MEKPVAVRIIFFMREKIKLESFQLSISNTTCIRILREVYRSMNTLCNKNTNKFDKFEIIPSTVVFLKFLDNDVLSKFAHRTTFLDAILNLIASAGQKSAVPYADFAPVLPRIENSLLRRSF